jgi:N-acetylglucosamine kinase-like BadF-type ATPase
MAATSSRSYYVGVDLGGTKILAGVFNRYLKLRNTVKFKTKAVRGVDAVIDRMERAIREVVSESGLCFEFDSISEFQISIENPSENFCSPKINTHIVTPATRCCHVLAIQSHVDGSGQREIVRNQTQ